MNDSMEFEENKPTSDEDRHRAESRRLTLDPVHADVTPDDIPLSESAARYDNAPAVANIASDTEVIASIMQPTQSLLGAQSTSPQRTRKPLVGLVVCIAAFTSLAVIALLK